MRLVALLLSGCTAGYVAPDLSGLTVNLTGTDGPVDEDLGAVDAGHSLLTADKTALPFGTVVTHQKSVSLPLVISSSGDPSLIGDVTITGAGFVIVSDGCTGQLVSASCTLQVRFTPETAGAASATLTVSGSGGGVASVMLSGTGANAGAIQLMPSSAPFASVAMTMSAELSLTLKNVGSVQSGAIAIDLSGPDVAQFHLGANNCAGGLAPSATCTLTLRFVPTATGAFSATLAAQDAFGGTVTAAISGTGT